MKEFCLVAIEQLQKIDNKSFGPLFIKLRLEFFRKFQRNLITSTIHGIDFFHNVVFCCNGGQWEEKGEYGDNFRKIIKLNKL